MGQLTDQQTSRNRNIIREIIKMRGDFLEEIEAWFRELRGDDD
jgi:hypothetical protein